MLEKNEKFDLEEGLITFAVQIIRRMWNIKKVISRSLILRHSIFCGSSVLQFYGSSVPQFPRIKQWQ